MSQDAGLASHACELLNDRHKGEAVFILGAGPGLAELSSEDVKQLEARPSIGVNLTFYVAKPRYFLSAYIGQALLARHRCPDATVLHMRPVYAPPLVPGIIPLKRSMYDPARGLTRALAVDEPTLFTKNNVVLGATHLAFVMGARRIVYIGVEQRDQLHFWHRLPQLLPVMREDVEILRDVPFLDVDHPYATYQGAVAKIERTAEECRGPFYKYSHAETFEQYFAFLRSEGIELISTSKDSVVCDAGAEHRALAEVLGANT